MPVTLQAVEEYASGLPVVVDYGGPQNMHVMLSVRPIGSNPAAALLTPGQARELAAALIDHANSADQLKPCQACARPRL